VTTLLHLTASMRINDRARLMPRDVCERLKVLGLIDGRSELTAAGRRWLDERRANFRVETKTDLR